MTRLYGLHCSYCRGPGLARLEQPLQWIRAPPQVEDDLSTSGVQAECNLVGDQVQSPATTMGRQDPPSSGCKIDEPRGCQPLSPCMHRLDGILPLNHERSGIKPQTVCMYIQRLRRRCSRRMIRDANALATSPSEDRLDCRIQLRGRFSGWQAHAHRAVPEFRRKVDAFKGSIHCTIYCARLEEGRLRQPQVQPGKGHPPLSYQAGQVPSTRWAKIRRTSPFGSGIDLNGPAGVARKKIDALPGMGLETGKRRGKHRIGLRLVHPAHEATMLS